MWYFVGFFFISALGTFLHFAYELSGKLFIVGLYCPVNESPWEHMKLIFTPSVLYFLCTLYFSYFFARSDSQSAHAMHEFQSRLAFGIACGIVVGILHIVVVYYIILWWTYNQDRFVYDIVNYLSAVLLELLCVLYVYQDIHVHACIGYLTLIIFLCLFPLLTLSPIHHVFFRDPVTGDFGYPL